jgi:hypothetical protein
MGHEPESSRPAIKSALPPKADSSQCRRACLRDAKEMIANRSARPEHEFSFQALAGSVGLKTPRNRLRQTAILLKRFKLIWVVQSFAQKYSGCAVGQIRSTHSAVPRSTGGALRIVTDVERGMRWTRRRARRAWLTRTAKSYGPDIPTLVSSGQVICSRRWLSSPVHRGEYEGNRKTIARGKPV